jgi:hypothetical protein
MPNLFFSCSIKRALRDVAPHENQVVDASTTLFDFVVDYLRQALAESSALAPSSSSTFDASTLLARVEGRAQVRSSPLDRDYSLPSLLPQLRPSLLTQVLPALLTQLLPSLIPQLLPALLTQLLPSLIRKTIRVTNKAWWAPSGFFERIR